MIRRDYILRIIEEFIGAIHHVLNLSSKGRYDAAHEEIERSLQELIHLNSDGALAATEAELVARMQILSVDEDWRARCLIVATMLAAEGDIRRHGPDVDASYPFYLRALHLAMLAHSRDEDKGDGSQPEWPDSLLSVEYATSKLDDYLLPFDTQIALLDFYRAGENLAKAEDLLFTWLDEQPGNEALRRYGVELYEELLAQPDDMLANAGLPRGEVEDGLKELRVRKVGG